MSNENRVLVHHQDGLCEYAISEVELRVNDGCLDLEISTRRNPESPLRELGSPRLFVESAKVAASSIATLMRERIEAATGEDTFRIYLSGHFTLDNNVLTIERAAGDEFRLEWHADSVDLNYYDKRAQRNRIEVHARFRAGD